MHTRRYACWGFGGGQISPPHAGRTDILVGKIWEEVQKSAFFEHLLMVLCEWYPGTGFRRKQNETVLADKSMV